jgi:hypothetical protein
VLTADVFTVACPRCHTTLPAATYYRALPFVDGNGRYADIWRIWAQSFRVLGKRLLSPGMEPQRILDLGTGSGWPSCLRLAVMSGNGAE